MDREADQMKIKQLLTATIASLCNNSLSYSRELTIQGLLGITIDHKDILLVNINEILRHGGSATVAQQCQAGTAAEAEHTQSSCFQPAGAGMEQNFTSDNSIAVRQRHSVKSAATSKNRGQHSHTAVVNYAQAYSSSMQNIKTEPGFEQAVAQPTKMEPAADYTGGYYAGDEDNSYDNYDMYYDQAGSMYVDSGGSFSNTDQFTEAVEYRKPSAQKVQRMRMPAKKSSAAGKSVNKAASQSQSGSKDVNSSLIQRALDLVHEGQLTAGVAIKLFGIPRSTFYKKLSMCNQQPQPVSAHDTQTDQYYQTEGDFQTDFGGDITDSFVDASGNADIGISAGQWSNYGNYYAT